MSIEFSPLIPGKVDPEHLDMLLSDTKIGLTAGDDRMKKALHGLFVDNLATRDLLDQYKVNRDSLYAAKKAVQKRHQYAWSVARFYQPATSPPQKVVGQLGLAGARDLLMESGYGSFPMDTVEDIQVLLQMITKGAREKCALVDTVMEQLIEAGQRHPEQST